MVAETRKGKVCLGAHFWGAAWNKSQAFFAATNPDRNRFPAGCAARTGSLILSLLPADSGFQRDASCLAFADAPIAGEVGLLQCVALGA